MLLGCCLNPEVGRCARPDAEDIPRHVEGIADEADFAAGGFVPVDGHLDYLGAGAEESKEKLASKAKPFTERRVRTRA